MTTTYSNLALYFKALAHPARLHIVDILRSDEVCVCHIEAALNKRQAYVSQQLMILREAGFVESRKDGLQVYYRLTDPKVAELLNVFDVLEHRQLPQLIEDCPCPACSVGIETQEQEIISC
jgi:ArsR family transcriptional regulator